MSDDVRERLIEEVSKVLVLHSAAMFETDDPDIAFNLPAAIVDALGLVTDRKLRVLTEEGWYVDRWVRAFTHGDSQRVEVEFKLSGSGPDFLVGDRLTTIEAAVAAAWEARGS